MDRWVISIERGKKVHKGRLCSTNDSSNEYSADLHDGAHTERLNAMLMIKNQTMFWDVCNKK